MAACPQKGCLTLLVFLLCKTVSTQQVYLQPFNSANVECNDGSVIDGRDQVVMVGSVTANGTTPVYFEFLKERVSSAFSPDCTINVDVDGCSNQSTSSCYCQEKSGNNYTLVYNSTADIRDSGATLRLSYQSLVSDQQLPIVHGVELVSVTIDWSKISLSNVCNQAFELGHTYDFEICGINFVSAEFYIGTDANIGPWTTAINNCASFSVAIETMTSLTFAYRETQGCQRQYTTSCSVMDSESEPACGDACVIGIVVGVGVVVVVVVGAIVIFVFWKMRTILGAKPESPRCDPPTLTPDKTALSVTCSTDKVFPQAQCVFHRHGFSNDTEIIEAMKERMYNYQENSGTNTSKAFSAIFSRFECCAVTNYSYDFQIGNSTDHTRGFVFAPERPSNYARFYIIPITCCKGFDYEAELTPTIFTEHDFCLTRPSSTNSYQSGCFDKIKDNTNELGRILLDIGETTLVYEGDVSDVSYTHESYTTNESLIYYKSTCTLTYPVNTPGSYAFFVDMFVNIGGTPYGLQQSPVSDSFNLNSESEDACDDACVIGIVVGAVVVVVVVLVGATICVLRKRRIVCWK